MDTDLIEKEDQETDPLQERLQKLNDKMDALAKAKKKMKDEFKEREAKKRQAKIFLIGEFFEHYAMLNLDKKIIMGIIGTAAENLTDPAQVKRWKDVGGADYKKYEEMKAARYEAKKAARKSSEENPAEKTEPFSPPGGNNFIQSATYKEDEGEKEPD